MIISKQCFYHTFWCLYQQWLLAFIKPFQYLEYLRFAHSCAAYSWLAIGFFDMHKDT